MVAGYCSVQPGEFINTLWHTQGVVYPEAQYCMGETISPVHKNFL